MKVLLDTCTLIWATLSPSTLSREAREAIADQKNIIFVSAASAWEIATKVRIGKLPGVEKLERDYLDVMEDRRLYAVVDRYPISVACGPVDCGSQGPVRPHDCGAGAGFGYCSFKP